ncbi:Hypothetical predicted protein, partial [Olea europaea subsp. europaea]
KIEKKRKRSNKKSGNSKKSNADRTPRGRFCEKPFRSKSYLKVSSMMRVSQLSSGNLKVEGPQGLNSLHEIGVEHMKLKVKFRMNNFALTYHQVKYVYPRSKWSSKIFKPKEV